MNNREAHFYLEELQRMMTQHRGIFSEEFVCANGMAIQALEPERKKGKWIDVNGNGSLYECDQCHDRSCCAGKYCMECGAQMEVEDNG